MRVERQHWERAAKDKVAVVPFPATKPQFIESALLGRMTQEDQAYMARAILSLSDENAEMKQRITALEMVTSQLARKVFDEELAARAGLK